MVLQFAIRDSQRRFCICIRFVCCLDHSECIIRCL